jgi:hypothetical protein
MSNFTEKLERWKWYPPSIQLHWWIIRFEVRLHWIPRSPWEEWKQDQLSENTFMPRLANIPWINLRHILNHTITTNPRSWPPSLLQYWKQRVATRSYTVKYLRTMCNQVLRLNESLPSTTIARYVMKRKLFHGLAVNCSTITWLPASTQLISFG